MPASREKPNAWRSTSPTHAVVIDFCQRNAVDLVVVGPETPLAAGIVDDLGRAGIKAFGPGKQAAQLEGSKGFTKALCTEFNIPTGEYRRFNNAAEAVRYVRAQGAPIVVKADGLAAGKGVVVAQTLREAEDAVAMMFDGAFGAAGAEVVIEEFLPGREISFFALCDGDTAIALATRAGPQARVRSRPGTEYRRHGRLFADAVRDRRHPGRDHGKDHFADRRRDEGARHARFAAYCMPGSC